MCNQVFCDMKNPPLFIKSRLNLSKYNRILEIHSKQTGFFFPSGERLTLMGSHVHHLPRASFVENRTHKSCISSSPEAGVNTSISPITWWEAETRTLKPQLHLGNLPLPPSTHVLMLHVFEQTQLPVSPLSKYLRLERPVELLNGHFLFRPLIYRRAVVNNGTPSHYLRLSPQFPSFQDDPMVCSEVLLPA